MTVAPTLKKTASLKYAHTLDNIVVFAQVQNNSKATSIEAGWVPLQVPMYHQGYRRKPWGAVRKDTVLLDTMHAADGECLAMRRLWVCDALSSAIVHRQRWL